MIRGFLDFEIQAIAKIPQESPPKKTTNHSKFYHITTTLICYWTNGDFRQASHFVGCSMELHNLSSIMTTNLIGEFMKRDKNEVDTRPKHRLLINIV